MALFGLRASGEIDFGWLPEDIGLRVMRRVEEHRLFGGDTEQRFRLVREDPLERHYRQAPAPLRSLHIMQDGGRSLFAEIRLSFDGPQVRYDITFARSRHVVFAVPLLLVSAAMMVAGGSADWAPLLGAGFVGFGTALSLVLSDGFIGATNARRRARAAVDGLLRQEIRDAKSEAGFRVTVGADTTLERARAVLAVLDARKVALTESERSRILSASDEATASRWLAKAATATSFAEVVGGAEGVDAEDDRSSGFREGSRQ